MSNRRRISAPVISRRSIDLPKFPSRVTGPVETFEPEHLVVDAISACKRMGTEKTGFDYPVGPGDVGKPWNITCIMTKPRFGLERRGECKIGGERPLPLCLIIGGDENHSVMREGAMNESTQSRQKRGGARRPVHYHLRLFVAGDEPNSAMAKASLNRICSTYLSERDFSVEIIDVLRDFRPALEESILVTPALIVQSGGARTVIFGNLADTGKILAALQIGSERQ